MVYSEILSFAYETFRSNKVRFALTALGMVIGTASLILVVTIGMTGKQYVLNQIQSIGTNQIEAAYQSDGQRVAKVPPDPLTIDDMKAALEEVPGIVAASPVVSLGDAFRSAEARNATSPFWESFPTTRLCATWWSSAAGFLTARTSRSITRLE
jgi:putative ABC transport system permease protein